MKLSDNNWYSINNTVIKKIDVELVGNSLIMIFIRIINYILKIMYIVKIIKKYIII